MAAPRLAKEATTLGARYDRALQPSLRQGLPRPVSAQAETGLAEARLRPSGLRRGSLRYDRACRAEAGVACKGWWSQAGSNRRPLACHASALPAELWPRHLMPRAPWATRRATKP